jgi:hypothetical protein
MSYNPTAEGPIIVWCDYGCEGWLPSSYPTLTDALLAYRSSTTFVLTRLVEYEVVDLSQTEKITLDTPTTDQA